MRGVIWFCIHPQALSVITYDAGIDTFVSKLLCFGMISVHLAYIAKKNPKVRIKGILTSFRGFICEDGKEEAYSLNI